MHASSSSQAGLQLLPLVDAYLKIRLSSRSFLSTHQLWNFKHRDLPWKKVLLEISSLAGFSFFFPFPSGDLDRRVERRERERERETDRKRERNFFGGREILSLLQSCEEEQSGTWDERKTWVTFRIARPTAKSVKVFEQRQKKQVSKERMDGKKDKITAKRKSASFWDTLYGLPSDSIPQHDVTVSLNYH